MGKKGKTVIPGAIKKMAGRPATKSGPIKRTAYKNKK